MYVYIYILLNQFNCLKKFVGYLFISFNESIVNQCEELLMPGNKIEREKYQMQKG